MIIGKTLDEVKKITNKDIVDALGGLPPEKMHCSVMGHEALENAIANYYGIEIKPEKEEKIVCKCFHLSQDDIISAIKKHNIKDVEELSKITQAGSACGQCIGELNKFFKNSMRKSLFQKYS